MQLLSHISTTSYLSLHLDGNLMVNPAIRDPVDMVAGGTWSFWNLRIEISLVEELCVGARAWISDYSSSASLLNAIKYPGLRGRRAVKV